MDLVKLGWSEFFKKSGVEESSVARVIAVHRSHLRAVSKEKEINLHLSGGLDQSPVVGDWVEITPEFEDEQGEPASIVKSILDRKSVLSRWKEGGEQVICANVDFVFIVSSANEDLKINRLRRFLVLVKESGAQPVILLSKTDLSSEAHKTCDDLSKQLEVKVWGTNTIDRSGVEQVKEMISLGTTAVFVGSSGVGKSTLVNLLLGESVQTTQEIRADDSKGRHTTTTRSLFLIPGRGMIIDTPGVREVQVFGGNESVNESFPRVASLVSKCKFSNCQHGNEPDCAIQKALSEGTLTDREWESYQTLRKEAAYAQRKKSKVEMSNAKKRWKDINKVMRQKRKFEGR